MADVQLPYAWHLDSGRMLHVDEALNGDDCGCICPEDDCRSPVQAVQGPERAHHFRHKPGEPGSRNCTQATAGETMVHKLAKQVIAENARLTLPPLLARHGDRYREYLPEAVLAYRPDQVILEDTSLRSIKPDVLIEMERESAAPDDLAVEIRYSHRTRQPKQAEFERLGMYAIEIDVRDLAPEDVAIPARFVPIVLSAARRHWLFHPKQAEANAAYREELAEISRKRAEEARKRAEAVAAAEAKQAEWRAEIEAERKREYAEQLAEIARKREAAAAEYARQVEAEREKDRARQVEAEATRERMRAAHRAAEEREDHRLSNRVGYLRDLPHVTVPLTDWPFCRRVEDGLTYNCHTPFLWRDIDRWRCLTCDPPLTRAVITVRGVS